MRQHEIIADKIEEAIHRMFNAIWTECSRYFEYTILFNPNKNQNWFIVLFVPTNTIFNKSLHDGTCYLLYSSLIENISNDEVLTNIDIYASFEIGDRPISIDDYDKLLIKVSEKRNRLRTTNEIDDKTICNECGHDFNGHQLMTLRNDESQSPRDGWLICPVESCTCFKTWTANYSD